MTIYHVLIDYDESDLPVIVLLDNEPHQWAGRRKYDGYGCSYYVYSVRRVPDSILIEIGRAIERQERKQTG